MFKYNNASNKEKTKMEVKVFLDIDDTLADTSKTIEKKYSYEGYGINTPIKKKKLIKDFLLWRDIKSHPEFWLSLPLRDSAREIYNEALKMTCKDNLYILSALPKLIFSKNTISFNSAAKEKANWIKMHFPEIPEKNILIVHARDKKKYARTDDKKTIPNILFDDSLKNVTQWKELGGVAYLVTPERFEKF